MQTNNQTQGARALIRSERNAVLCTLSKRIAGFPFGSVAPFAVSGAGEPIILISEIAEHTRNLRADARASLLIQDSAAMADPQAGARATLVGYAVPVPRAYLDDARRRYLGLFPNSASYFEAHDFSLFQIKVEQVRFIGGFGEIHWIEGRELVDAEADSSLDSLAPQVRAICDHMNMDHADALKLYAAAFADTRAEAAKMIHVDRDGFDMVAVEGGGHKHLRIDFPGPLAGNDQVRPVMVEMVRRAREMVG
jgi:putative heme iron utilization protein